MKYRDMYLYTDGAHFWTKNPSVKFVILVTANTTLPLQSYIAPKFAEPERAKIATAFLHQC